MVRQAKPTCQTSVIRVIRMIAEASLPLKIARGIMKYLFVGPINLLLLCFEGKLEMLFRYMDDDWHTDKV